MLSLKYIHPMLSLDFEVESGVLLFTFTNKFIHPCARDRDFQVNAQKTQSAVREGARQTALRGDAQYQDIEVLLECLECQEVNELPFWLLSLGRSHDWWDDKHMVVLRVLSAYSDVHRMVCPMDKAM